MTGKYLTQGDGIWTEHKMAPKEVGVLPYTCISVIWVRAAVKGMVSMQFRVG